MLRRGRTGRASANAIWTTPAVGDPAMAETAKLAARSLLGAAGVALPGAARARRAVKPRRTRAH